MSTRIDRETTQRILDAADIVEVVSEFVTLKRRGANYIGLCPFHNERTPSFSVSKSRGICKCFSCGKGGSPVNFLMELENMSYQEALRWLAKKYNIEIKEREVTDEERRQEQEREAMLAVNEFAMHHFEKVMADTDEGRDVGRAYFAERGINDLMVKRFHLGYALNKGNGLLSDALRTGLKEQYLLATGLCAKSERDGSVYDRFRGRVIYPVFGLSGKVVAFGGRILTSDKTKAKYVNSPESVIYSKSRELYGLYQSRQAIARKDKCILVEGYMDVISLHQSGVENVVASSGTSLTEGQIRLIQRFTSNVTVVYDSDAAGIKASLRGIDMLLGAGMNVKVLQFPDGEDPDSYAQAHSCEELERYMAANEVDFISFKTRVLLSDAANDPVRKSQVITDILNSIAVIPNAITRQLYVVECSRMLDIPERLLVLQLNDILKGKGQEGHRVQRMNVVEQKPEQDSAGEENAETAEQHRREFLKPFEREIIRYVLRYGSMFLCDAVDDAGNELQLNVLDYIEGELAADEIGFTVSVYGKAWERIADIVRNDLTADQPRFAQALNETFDKKMADGFEKIRREAKNLSDIAAREAQLKSETEQWRADVERNHVRNFTVRNLASDPDADMRHLAVELGDDKYALSKVHTKYQHIETEEERLTELIPRAVYELKNAILQCRIKDLNQAIAEAARNKDADKIEPFMKELMDLNQLRGEFARYLGERIITPNRL